MAKQEVVTRPTRSEFEPWFPFDLGEFFRWPDSWPSFPRGLWSLRAEEYSEDGKLVVRVDAPGIDPEKNVDIRLVDRTLHITVEREESEGRFAKPGYRSEVRYGRFTRTLPLPSGSKADAVSASYTDGVLEVTVPLAKEEPKGVHIPVAHA
jgi:HSP20 family protein